MTEERESLTWRRGPWRDVDDVEYATLVWVDWFKNDASSSGSATCPSAECEAAYYRQLE